MVVWWGSLGRLSGQAPIGVNTFAGTFVEAEVDTRPAHVDKPTEGVVTFNARCADGFTIADTRVIADGLELAADMVDQVPHVAGVGVETDGSQLPVAVWRTIGADAAAAVRVFVEASGDRPLSASAARTLAARLRLACEVAGN